MRKGEDIAKDGFNTRWKPGQSGNPAGKPKGTQHSSTRMRRLLDAVQKAKNPVTKQEEDFTTLELMDAALIARALKGDVIAYREILDRVEGKTAQPIEHTGKDGGPIEVEAPVWVIKKAAIETDGGTTEEKTE